VEEGSEGIALTCRSCGWKGEERLNLYSCPKCGSPLDLEYRPADTLPEPRDLLRCRGIWCFSGVLPSYGLKATLGEGLTGVTVFKLGRIGVAVKAEYQNPTGSFKDRGSALAISMAASKGAGEVVEDSSGNAGISTSCYATAHGLRAVIVAPKSAPKGKLDLLRLCGAEVVLAETRDLASELAPMVAVERGGAYLPHTWLPHHVEAMKTIALEIHYQVEELPDTIFVPTSSGTLLIGLYRGFRELARLGYRRELPRLIAVQTRSFHPLYRLLKGGGLDIEEENLADGISLRRPPRLVQMAEAVRETSGDVIVVGNSDIREALKMLIKKGYLVEPTSAVPLAGLMKAIASGLDPDRPMVILTGSGLKMPQVLAEVVGGK